MTLSSFHKQLLASDDFAQYGLRATFFEKELRSLRMWELIHEVQQLAKVSGSFDWGDRKKWGIDEVAWARVESKQISPLSIFCHPRVLSEQPPLLRYYRTISLISQKGLSSLVPGDIAKIESGKIDRIEPGRVSQIALALNCIVSIVIKTAAEIDERDFVGFHFATAGVGVQGSWNNAIGAQGEEVIKRILVNNLRDEIAQIVWRNGKTLDYTPGAHSEVLDRIKEIRVVRLKDAFHLLFSSEPDVSLRDPRDLPVMAIEVKAGTDTAGALERLGAAMKSFENDRNLNPRVVTVYVVRCMTPELRKRIQENNPFDYTFGLTELMADEKTQLTFSNLIVRALTGKLRK